MSEFMSNIHSPISREVFKCVFGMGLSHFQKFSTAVLKQYSTKLNEK